MTFKEKLENQEAEEGTNVSLRCVITKPGVSVEWKRGTLVLKSGEKYQMKQKDSVNELLINKVVLEDSGDYSCVCGDQKTTASLNIKGRKRNSQDLIFGAIYEHCMQLFFSVSLKSACHGGLQIVSAFFFLLYIHVGILCNACNGSLTN